MYVRLHINYHIYVYIYIYDVYFFLPDEYDRTAWNVTSDTCRPDTRSWISGPGYLLPDTQSRIPDPESQILGGKDPATPPPPNPPLAEEGRDWKGGGWIEEGKGVRWGRGCGEGRDRRQGRGWDWRGGWGEGVRKASILAYSAGGGAAESALSFCYQRQVLPILLRVKQQNLHWVFNTSVKSCLFCCGWSSRICTDNQTSVKSCLFCCGGRSRIFPRSVSSCLFCRRESSVMLPGFLMPEIQPQQNRQQILP